MIKGNVIGAFAFILLLFLAYMLNILGSFFPDYSQIALAFSVCLISLGGFLFFWSITLEGNTFLCRNFGGSNIGISIYNEPGRLGSFSQINVNKDDFKKYDFDYKIINEALIVRKGMGIPYILHKARVADPLNIWDQTKGFDSADNSAYLSRKVALETAKKLNSRIQRFEMLIVIGFVVIAGGLLLTYFKLDDIASIIKSGTNLIISKIPVPTPIPIGGIPNA